MDTVFNAAGDEDFEDACAGEVTGKAAADDAADTRYALTALGKAVLAGTQRFAGFGPCAISRPASRTGTVAGVSTRRRRRSRAERPRLPLG